MFIERKVAKYLWVIVILFGVTSSVIALSDLLTTSLYFDGLFGATVFAERIDFNVLDRLFGAIPNVSAEGLISGLMVMFGQVFFGIRAKLARKGSNEKYAYWVGYAALALADTFTDVSYRANGGNISVAIVLVSFFLYNVMSELGVTFAIAYIWEAIVGLSGDWFGNAKENVKNLRGGGGNDGGGNTPRPPKAPTGKQHNHNQRHNQQPATQFALDNNTAVTLQPRQEQRPQRQRTMQVNGQVINSHETRSNDASLVANLN